MAKIAFLLLCHKDPDAIIRQADQLTATGDYIAIHFDARAPKQAYDAIRAGLSDNPNVAFVKKRVKCGWGEWSLVQATLNTVKTAVETFPRASHFYMVSGDCMAIKSAAFAHDFLDRADVDYVESFDYFRSDWIKTGFREERLIYRHWFNERKHKTLFYASFELQKKLGLTRDVPADLQIMIGSQWWCLRRRTVEMILDFVRNRRDVVRFFRTTWIPDETFFQTLVRHLVPREEIENRTLTFLMFTDYGMPVTFYNDHYDLLLGQDALFARKISPAATVLKERLGDLFASEQTDFTITNEGRALYPFLSGRGRVGRRFGVRFWERDTTIGSGRDLLIIACKKWHVAKRLVAAIRQHTELPALAYLFNEDDADLPDLGGVQTSLDKRTRHRRAFMRMLFEHYGQNRLVICLDPKDFDVVQDFYADRANISLLEVACDFSDDYLIGHAKRTGFLGWNAPQYAALSLLPTVRNDIEDESERLNAAGFDKMTRLREAAEVTENAAALATFLELDMETALLLAQAPDLFAD